VLVVSLLLIAAAALLLVLGLWQSSSVLLSGSIAASLFAAVMLVVAARQVTNRLAAAADRSPDGRSPDGRSPDGRSPDGRSPDGRSPDGRSPDGREFAEDLDSSNTQTMTIPVQGGPPEYPDDDADPPDEPAPQQVSAADAARVGRMVNEVLVVDGRPRYHLAGCVHLLGRVSEPLPVSEAIELGFTPCSLCEPDSALLADARRV
jgi:hypothetical protein